MFEIDKQKFGSFVAMLRKEKGLTQKELAKLLYISDKAVRAFQVRGKWGRIYLFAFLISGLECFLCALFGAITIGLPLVVLLGMIFGGYFCFFAVVRLPDYYDENRISFYNDSGIFNISFPGLVFNNNNWPHILKAGRIWAVTAMVGYPAISFMLYFLLPGAWWVEVAVEMVFIFGGTFAPMYVAGKKYEKGQDN